MFIQLNRNAQILIASYRVFYRVKYFHVVLFCRFIFVFLFIVFFFSSLFLSCLYLLFSELNSLVVKTFTTILYIFSVSYIYLSVFSFSTRCAISFKKSSAKNMKKRKSQLLVFLQGYPFKILKFCT